MALVATAFLAFAGFHEVVTDSAVAFAFKVVVFCSVEHGAVIEEYAHGDHGLEHGCVPVAVGGWVEVFDDGVADFAEHGGELCLFLLWPDV